ncbi:unnamed protein product [Effrenium voratum]|uniref:Uncharacterized protein n=1 Tax=Effrenium voratum TaxID=2562239 RepID=A0AA36J6G2_9DINO|nr:unnamed protein product [Effrenium voratum]CAJ1456025.1 unnamed protein product [Effrenium voratum]
MEEATEPAGIAQLMQAQRVMQRYLDKTVVWVRVRWAIFAALLLMFAARVYLKQGFFVVSYGLGIYMLNLFINFLSPVMRPDFRDPWLAGSRYWIRLLILRPKMLLCPLHPPNIGRELSQELPPLLKSQA